MEKENSQNIIKKYTLRIHGMHCKSCVLLTESELKEFPYITQVKASLKSNLVEVDGYFEDKTPEEVAQNLSVVLKKHGYTLSALNDLRQQEYNLLKNKNLKEFKIAVPITIFFIAFYIFLQKIGLVDVVSIDKVSYGSAFIIGLIASVSSCMAVVGGLLISISASFAKSGNKIKPQIMFHLGRIIFFFIFGGIIGYLGTLFQLSGVAMFILNSFIAFVMLILGINLLDIFSYTKRFQLGMPKFLSKHAIVLSKFNNTFTPFLVGLATFFLPCGFTQAMQIYTLSTGSFTKGAFIMLSFALGTLPVLGLISFGSFSINKNSNFAGIFFKVSGLVVILFALFNFINALVVMNFLSPVFNF